MQRLAVFLNIVPNRLVQRLSGLGLESGLDGVLQRFRLVEQLQITLFLRFKRSILLRVAPSLLDFVRR